MAYTKVDVWGVDWVVKRVDAWDVEMADKMADKMAATTCVMTDDW